MYRMKQLLYDHLFNLSLTRPLQLIYGLVCMGRYFSRLSTLINKALFCRFLFMIKASQNAQRWVNILQFGCRNTQYFPGSSRRLSCNSTPIALHSLLRAFHVIFIGVFFFNKELFLLRQFWNIAFWPICKNLYPDKQMTFQFKPRLDNEEVIWISLGEFNWEPGPN